MDTSTELANGLDRDIAALKAKAADYGARHRVIENCTWPQGARIAVNFTADFDAMLLRRVLNEPPMQLAKGEFGGRVGIWRLIELFDSHAIKATIFTPGRICELYPQAVKAASQSGHEIADHMWEHQVPKDPVLEREHLRRAKDAIEKLTGKRPVGTRSWHTRAAPARGGLHLQFARHARPPPALHQRARRLEGALEPAVPLRHRRRDVLQLRLAQHRE